MYHYLQSFKHLDKKAILNTLNCNSSEFENEKKQKQATIMDKILVEEDRLKKRKKQQPHLWTDPKSDKSKVITYSIENHNFKMRGFMSKHLDILSKENTLSFVLSFLYTKDPCVYVLYIFILKLEEKFHILLVFSLVIDCWTPEKETSEDFSRADRFLHF